MLRRIARLLKMQPPLFSDTGLLFGSGPVVPVDATQGWQTGAIWQHTDGTSGTALYVNEGSVTSCDFNAVESPATTLFGGVTAGTALAGKALTLSATNVLQFSSLVPAYGSSNEPFIGIGTYDTAMTINNTSNYSFVPVQVNLLSAANAGVAGSQVAAARLRVNASTAPQANTAIHVLQLRSDVSVNVYAAACISASMNISGATTVGGETVQCGYFSITGAGAITCSADVNVLEATYKQTAGGGGVDNVAQFSCNATGCAITSLLNLTAYAGTVTNGITLAGAMTNAFSFPAAGVGPTVAGGASSGADAGTTVKIKVLVGGAAYFILASDTPTFT